MQRGTRGGVWPPRRGRVVTGIALALSVLPAAAADASVTFGRDLSGAPNLATYGTSNSVTIANAAVDPSVAAAGGGVAPSDGVIVAWRMRTTGNVPVTVALRVIRGGQTGVSTSLPQAIPAVGGVYGFEARIPVRAGDALGLNTIAGPGPGAFVAENSSNGVIRIWNPPLADGATAPPTQADIGGSVFLQADLEPDCDGDGFGDESQDANTSTCLAPPPPETTITKKPKKKTSKRRARFEFSSSVPGSTFECKLDGGEFTACASLYTKKVKAGRRHTFKVLAIAPNGTAEAEPATFRWKVRKS